MVVKATSQKGVKSQTRGRKLRGGVYWQWSSKQEGIKQAVHVQLH
jgi:hypothetical protein